MTTTFLEYVCTKLLGRPLSTNGKGESYWECPYCESPKFHTRDVSPRYPAGQQKFSCYRCSKWGDAWDLLEHLYLNEGHQRLMRRWKKLREDWEALEDERDAKRSTAQRKKIHAGRSRRPSTSSRSISSSGADGATFLRSDPRAVGEAFDSLTEGEVVTLSRALDIAVRKRVSLKMLANYCHSAVSERILDNPAKFKLIMRERRHLDECQDRDCDEDVCRQARGLKPLTDKQYLARQRRKKRETQLWRDADDEEGDT